MSVRTPCKYVSSCEAEARGESLEKRTQKRHPLPFSKRIYLKQNILCISSKYNTYCGIHDACSMCTYGICYVADVDCVEMFVITGSLHKNLIVQVVQELGDEDMNIPHDFQHIQPLNHR